MDIAEKHFTVQNKGKSIDGQVNTFLNPEQQIILANALGRYLSRHIIGRIYIEVDQNKENRIIVRTEKENYPSARIPMNHPLLYKTMEQVLETYQ